MHGLVPILVLLGYEGRVTIETKEQSMKQGR